MKNIMIPAGMLFLPLSVCLSVSRITQQVVEELLQTSWWAVMCD